MEHSEVRLIYIYATTHGASAKRCCIVGGGNVSMSVSVSVCVGKQNWEEQRNKDENRQTTRQT